MMYSKNGLRLWNEQEIRWRRMFQDHFAYQMWIGLNELNPAWVGAQVEASILTPRDRVGAAYTTEDVYVVEDGWVLRPETTPGTYEAAKEVLKTGKPPFFLWQVGKSFRKEQDQPQKFMRLKEFYQQEFQCFYTADSANDYQKAILPKVSQMIADLLPRPMRTVESNRLPAYSIRTIDIEVHDGERFMEVCSVSVRTDFSEKAVFQTKKGQVEKDLRVLEVAIGLDRLVHLKGKY